nr:MAG TPA: hypothetical protein [Caudoviricetes sp.]
MTIKAWTSKETGLPSFFLDGKDIGAQVYAGNRLVNPTGTPQVFSDMFAAPGVETEYSIGSLRYGLRRVGPPHALASLDGRVTATVSWIGDDARAYDTRVATFDLQDRRTAIARYSTVSAEPTGRLEFLAYADESALVEKLLDTRQPLVSLHSHAACGLRDCDVPEVRCVTVTSASSKRTGRRDRVRREWALGYKPADMEEAATAAGGGSLITWGAVQAKYGKWRHMTYLQAAQWLTGMPL